MTQKTKLSAISTLAILCSGLVLFLTARSLGSGSRPNDPTSRVRPNLFADKRPVREILALTPEQIEKFHKVERAHLDELQALMDPKLSRGERRQRRDEITTKINAGVQGFLSADQFAKLLQIEKEEGSFRGKP